MSEKSLVIQHNNLIEARYRLSIEAQRLIKTLVSLIQSSDDDFKPYEIRAVDLAKMIGVSNDGYYKSLKRVTRSVVGNVIQFIDKDGNEIQTTWLSSAIYMKGQGTIILRFDPILKPYLLHLKSLFTSYELGNILRLKGMYSIRVYELLKQYERIGKREFTIDELRTTLKVDSEYYKEYKNLKRYILKPAQLEISEKTDLECSFSEIKKGRFIEKIVFHITIKKRQIIEPLVEIDPSKEEPKTQIESSPYQEPTKQEIPKVPPQNQTSARKQRQIITLFDMGVAHYAVEELLANFDADKIDQGIAYTKEKLKEGTVKDSAAFVIASIKRAFVDPQAHEKAKEAEALRLREERENALYALRQRWENIKQQYNDAQSQVVENALKNMTAEELDAYKQQFVQSTAYNLMKGRVNESEASKKSFFLGHMRTQLAIDTFEVWAQKNGVDVSEFPAIMLSEVRSTVYL